MKRSEAERSRAAHTVWRLKATIESIELALRHTAGGPPSNDSIQALIYTAHDLSLALAKIEAYTRAEADADAESGRGT